MSSKIPGLSAILGKKSKGNAVRNSSLTYRKVTIGRNFEGANFRPVAGGLSFWIRVILAPVVLPFIFFYTCMCTTENTHRKIYVMDDEDEDSPFLVRKVRSARRVFTKIFRKLGCLKKPEAPQKTPVIAPISNKGPIKAPISKSNDPAFALALFVARTDQVDQAAFNREIDAAEAARQSSAEPEIMAAGGGATTAGKNAVNLMAPPSAMDNKLDNAFRALDQMSNSRPDAASAKPGGDIEVGGGIESQSRDNRGTGSGTRTPSEGHGHGRTQPSQPKTLMAMSPDEVSAFKEMIERGSEQGSGPYNKQNYPGGGNSTTVATAHEGPRKSSLKPSSQAATVAAASHIEPYMDIDDVRMTNRTRKNIAKQLDANTSANRGVPASIPLGAAASMPGDEISSELLDFNGDHRVSFSGSAEIIGTSQTVEDGQQPEEKQEVVSGIERGNSIRMGKLGPISDTPASSPLKAVKGPTLANCLPPVR